MGDVLAFSGVDGGCEVGGGVVSICGDDGDNVVVFTSNFRFFCL